MDSYLIVKLAEIEAIKTEILDMNTANSERDAPSESVVYSENDFQYKANELRKISIELLNK